MDAVAARPVNVLDSAPFQPQMSQTISDIARQETRVEARRGAWARGAGMLGSALVLLAALAIVALLLASLVAPRVLGYRTYVIHGSSMEPAIEVGSLVVTRPVSAGDLQVGDVVVFESPSNGVTLTHRIVEVREEGSERLFRTKGDASPGGDPLEIDLSEGTQQVAFHVPYVGYFVNFAGSPVGILLFVALPAAALLALTLAGRRQATGRAEDVEGGQA